MKSIQKSSTVHLAPCVALAAGSRTALPRRVILLALAFSLVLVGCVGEVTPALTPTVPAIASPAPTSKPTVLRVAYSRGGHIMLWTEGEVSRPLGDASNTEQTSRRMDAQWSI
jgi:hypothetical protein